MLGPFKAHICELLETHKTPPVANQRIFEILGEKGSQGKITILRNYLAQISSKKAKEIVVYRETPLGDTTKLSLQKKRN